MVSSQHSDNKPVSLIKKELSPYIYYRVIKSDLFVTALFFEIPNIPFLP